MSKSNFLICYDYIKNNLYINLDDGNHIGIVWSCSNAVKTHNISYTLDALSASDLFLCEREQQEKEQREREQ